MSRKVDIVSVKKNMRAPLMRKKPFYAPSDAGKGSCPTKCGGTHLAGRATIVGGFILIGIGIEIFVKGVFFS